MPKRFLKLFKRNKRNKDKYQEKYQKLLKKYKAQEKELKKYKAQEKKLKKEQQEQEFDPDDDILINRRLKQIKIRIERVIQTYNSKHADKVKFNVDDLLLILKGQIANVRDGSILNSGFIMGLDAGSLNRRQILNNISKFETLIKEYQKRGEYNSIIWMLVTEFRESFNYSE